MFAKFKIQACKKMIRMSEAIGMDVTKEKEMLDKMVELYETMSKVSVTRKRDSSKKGG